MLTKIAVKKQSYQDSLKLMAISTELRSIKGVSQVAAVMGTQSNIATLAQGGFVVEDALGAGPEDIVIAISGENDIAVSSALEQFHKLLAPVSRSGGGALSASAPRTLRSALPLLEGANLAVISVPGTYAALEAKKALNQGLHVMLFSDNVSVEEELALKNAAQAKGLLVMGPDCGTAIIDGVPLCFANRVARGPIGVVGASGTGIQEVTVLVDRLGSGISHAIGTGGRDLSDAIGGITMLAGLRELENDLETQVIVIISKPPGPNTMRKVLDAIKFCQKPVVAFLGNDRQAIAEAGAYPAETLEEAAAKAVAIVQAKDPSAVNYAYPRHDLYSFAQREAAGLEHGQVRLRGLFSGGTLAQEAIKVVGPIMGPVLSNIAKNPELKLRDVSHKSGSYVVDFGDDEFTRGRPHPMIDPSYRADRLAEELSDPSVAVILCDIVLGHGAHENPAGVVAEIVASARGANERQVAVLASVCGTDRDPQKRDVQVNILERAGIAVLPSNAYAAEAAGMIVAAARQRGLS